MAVARALARPKWTPARASTHVRPPVVAIQAAAACAWIVYAAILATSRPTTAAVRAPVWWCMPGMTLSRAGAASPLATIAAALPMWSLMAAAMTLPTAMPATQHVAVNSFQRRQWAAVAEFAAVYLGVWLIFGIAGTAALSLLPSASPHTVFAFVLTLAAAYQLTPLKRRALNRCHRSSPLRPSGTRAVTTLARFAWINGSGCVGSCWAAMLVMLVAPTARFGCALGLTAAMTYEKLTRRPRRGSRHVAWVFAVSAVAAAIGVIFT